MLNPFRRALFLSLCVAWLAAAPGCLADRLADEVAEQITEYKADKARAPSAAPEPAPVDEGPLRLLHATPTGEAKRVSEIRLKFSHRVLGTRTAGASDETAEALQNPATLEPAIDGAWRWEDVRTAVFEPRAGHAPMATDFRVTLHPALRSAAGHALEHTEPWCFSTPALKVDAVYPAGLKHPVMPLIFLSFNQPIERATIFNYINVFAQSERVELEMLRDPQVQEHDILAKLVANAPANHWIALKPTQKLPTSAEVVIELAEGAPSLQGPKRSTQQVVGRFRTIDPLAVSERACASERHCARDLDWFIRFNHALDAEDFSPAKVRITPKIKDAQISLSERTISITGRAAARTDYMATLDASLRDRFGQTLGQDTTFTFGVDGEAPFFGATQRALSVLDPELKGHFPLYSRNHKRLHVTVHRVTPDDWQSYLEYREDKHRRDDETGATPQPPGKKIIDRTIRITAKPDTLTRTLLDLRPALNRKGHGQLIVTVKRPPDETEGMRVFEVYTTWVQVTEITLHARTRGNELLVWTSTLRGGQPLGDVQISLQKTGRGAGQTNREGLRVLPLPKEGYSRATGRRTGDLLVATSGQDTAILPQIIPASPKDRRGWLRYSAGSTLLWHTMQDGSLYQRGETATVRGWLRPVTLMDTDPLPPMTVKKLSYSAYSTANSGEDFDRGQAEVDEKGHFRFEVVLGDSPKMRAARVTLSARGAPHQHQAYHELQIHSEEPPFQPFMGR